MIQDREHVRQLVKVVVVQLAEVRHRGVPAS